MLGALLRRNMSQKLSALLVALGLAWGLMLLRYTAQQPRHQSSAELRQEILELSRRYVKVLTEENQLVPGGPQGTSMAGYADLKRTIAVLLDDILTRLVKLEGKIDLVANASAANASHPASAAGVHQVVLPVALQKALKLEAAGRPPRKHTPRPPQPYVARRPRDRFRPPNLMAPVH
ncbi:coiled-coil domain-containing protein 126 [Gadus chalcogrammus]|uniref:coiled-coil domain-containing protein 126 n=1 Tax=Gadus chalcogrammus TaxID=1042646 RepID=UPI0024C47AAA|nr:coiled-coil domain-containing protein 126 [Gadus chalcogrammus]